MTWNAFDPTTLTLTVFQAASGFAAAPDPHA
jgi:hypothetical protein